MLSKNAIKPRGFHDWIWQYQQFLGLCSNFFEHLFWKKGEVYINNANWQFVLRPLSVMQYTFKNTTVCGINNTTLCGINRRTMWREFQIWRVFRKWSWLFRTGHFRKLQFQTLVAVPQHIPVWRIATGNLFERPSQSFTLLFAVSTWFVK